MEYSLNGPTTDLAHRMKVTNLSHSGNDYLLAFMQHINIRPHSVSSCMSDSRSGTRFSLHKSAFREILRSLCLFPKYLPKTLQTFVLRASFIIPFWQSRRGGGLFQLSQSKFTLLPNSHWNATDYTVVPSHRHLFKTLWEIPTFHCITFAMVKLTEGKC